jgi:hypothetical protein
MDEPWRPRLVPKHQAQTRNNFRPAVKSEVASDFGSARHGKTSIDTVHHHSTRNHRVAEDQVK